MKYIEGAWEKIAKAFAAVFGFLTGLYGGWSMTLAVLLGCMAVDYISGLIVAGMGKSKKTEGGGLDSSVGLNGLRRKGMILLVVLVAALLDQATGTGNSMFRDAACWFYIANECLSILENSSLAGVPWPAWLKKALEQMRDKEVEKPPDAGA